jgi:Rrf2 family protein
MGAVNISAKSDYAVRAMLLLADVDGAGTPGAQPFAAEALAERAGLPRKFLEAILVDLRRATLVTSVRGAGGGYRLTRPATAISLAAVIRAVDGPLAEVRGLRPHETTYTAPADHLPVVWVAVRAALRRVLDEVSLEQVRTGRFPAHVRRLAEPDDAWVNR